MYIYYPKSIDNFPTYQTAGEQSNNVEPVSTSIHTKKHLAIAAGQ